MNNHLLSVVLALGITHQASAQNRVAPAPGLPADSLNRIQFTGVVAVPGASAAELQARAREWVALTFQDAQQVTQLDDAARGVLIGRAYTTTWPDANGKRIGNALPLSFTFRLDFREGRYRYLVRELGVALTPSGPSSPSLNGAAIAASQQAYETAAWQLGATATVAASSRQGLLQPDYSPNAADYNVLLRFGSRWAGFSAAINKIMSQLLDSLRRHETAPVEKW